jgi:hypothetical protein
MIDLIIADHGREAIAGIAAAYRDGASDAEALEAGTGVPAQELYDRFFASFGVEAPTPIEAEPIPASNVDRPTAGAVDPGGVDPGADPGGEPPDVAAPGEGTARGDGGSDVVVVAILAAALVAAGVAAVAVVRRAERRSAP